MGQNRSMIKMGRKEPGLLLAALVAGLLLVLLLGSPASAPVPAHESVRRQVGADPATGQPLTAGDSTASRSSGIALPGTGERNVDRLAPSTWIVGKVKREDGIVVPGVDLAGFVVGSAEPRLVKTDSAGDYRMEFPDLGVGGVVELHVRGTGKDAGKVLGDRIRAVPGIGAEYRIDLLYAESELHIVGQLLWQDGEPVTNGFVSSGEGPRHPSDAFGRFDLEAAVFSSGVGLNFGYERAEVFSSGFRRIVATPEQVRQGALHGIELVLERPEVSREFLVMGGGSQPLEEAEIRISGEPKVWRTDAAGRAEVRVPPSVYGRSIRVEAPGYEPRYVAIEELEVEDGIQVVHLLEREIVPGRVIDSLGATVPFAKVYVSEDASFVGEIEVVAADGNGEFSFGAAVYGGPRYLVARGLDGARGSRLVPPWENPSEISVVVDRPYSLQGSVFSPDGAGLDGVVVSARRPGALDGTEYTTMTAIDGRWQLAVMQDEKYVVHLRKNGYVVREFPCSPGDAPTIVLEPAGVIDILLIQADTGEVLSRATVRITKGEPESFGASIALTQGRLRVSSPYHVPGDQAVLQVSDPILGRAEVVVTVQAPGASTSERVTVSGWTR